MPNKFNELCKLYADREYTGKQISLNSVSNSRIGNLEIVGETAEIGEGEKSPGNPYFLAGSKPEIKICGKNFLNSNGKFINGYLDNFNIDAVNGAQGDVYRTIWIKANLKQGDIITISSTKNFYIVRAIDNNNNKYTYNCKLPYTINIVKDCTELQISFREATEGSIFKFNSLEECKIQAEMGGKATEFVPHTEQNIVVEFELNNIDSIGDTYNPLTGEYVQRVKKLTLTGSNNEAWRLPATDENNAVLALTLKDMYYSNNVLCSILEHKGTAGGYAAALRSGVGVYRWTGDGNVYLYFVVPLSTAGTIEEWIKYLQNNLVQVCYRFSKPVITVINGGNIAVSIPNTTMLLEDNNNLGSIKTTLQTKGQ